MPGLVKAEFHCHTRFSKDSITQVEDLIAECRRKKIDRLVITDHNTISGAELASQLAPDLIIVGEELMTEKGELLAFFVKEALPRGLKPTRAIELLRQQSAFISVSHPFDSMRNGAWALADLEEIVPLVDAIETFNSRCSMQNANHAAVAIHDAEQLAQLKQARQLQVQMPTLYGKSGGQPCGSKISRMQKNLTGRWYRQGQKYDLPLFGCILLPAMPVCINR